MIVLASGSATRRALLASAGLDVVVDVPELDEAALKRDLAAGSTEAVARSLAEAKAAAVCPRHPGALVVGSDQMLDCDGRRHDKPADRAAARGQLIALRGRSHRLVTAVAVLRDGVRLWSATDCAVLRMRNFSDTFLDAYLDRVGATVLSSVGAYQLEGLGIQLFDRVEGDHFTILGLPLLPLLGFLRQTGELPS